LFYFTSGVLVCCGIGTCHFVAIFGAATAGACATPRDQEVKNLTEEAKLPWVRCTARWLGSVQGLSRGAHPEISACRQSLCGWNPRGQRLLRER